MAYQARSNRNLINCIRLFEASYVSEMIVFDVETTGKNAKKDYIVEFSAIKYKMDNSQMTVIEEKDIFIRPPVVMEDAVVEIHNITNDFLADKQEEKDVFPEIHAFFGENPIICGYNVNFDIEMMKSLYNRQHKNFQYKAAIDVLEMARDLVDRNEAENYKLSTIAELYGVGTDLTFHRAIDDVKATARLLNVFYTEYKRILQKTDFSVKDRVYIHFLYFWTGFNKTQRGIYVGTNLGKIWLSTFNKCWMSTQVDLSTVNIDQFETDIVKRTGLSFFELSKMTEKKFNQLKESRGGYI